MNSGGGGSTNIQTVAGMWGKGACTRTLSVLETEGFQHEGDPVADLTACTLRPGPPAASQDLRCQQALTLRVQRALQEVKERGCVLPWLLLGPVMHGC